MKKNRQLLAILMLLLLLITGCTTALSEEHSDDRVVLRLPTSEPIGETESIEEEHQSIEKEASSEEALPVGPLTSKEDVARYIFTYGKLPENFITKAEARELGWDSREGNLWEVTDHLSIGGDRFGNREGLLPKKQGRQYYEADIDYDGGYRGAKRIVFSNDGLVFYTDDHYESFEELKKEDYQ